MREFLSDKANLEDYPVLRLQKGRERRLLYGYRWVFSNEVLDPIGEFEPGSWVKVVSHKGDHLGIGYVNPHSLIAVRIVCPPGKKPSRLYFRRLLEQASEMRKKLYTESTCYRLFYSESDGLPGLIVDRYGDVLVYQITTLGASKLEDLIRELLIELFSPVAIVARNDTSARIIEGLPLEKAVVWGELPEELWVKIDELFFLVDPLNGQKTGHYLDQRENRKVLRKFSYGSRMLDLFCYDGGWGLSGALYGAKEIVFVDQSDTALDRAKINAIRNGLLPRCTFVESDVFEFLKASERKEFDIIVSDPPAFVKNKRALPQAIKGYTDLNRRALLAIRDGGILVSCSCSHHVSIELFEEILRKAALASGKKLLVLETRSQSPDHPILIAMPETRYLKCYVTKVLPK
ncbi:MAG: class I SAM-dependent rRNA methyltransferase [Syntrophobacterales bacterium]|nr:class I SAM-dependent rRNA methyltransferase [Syntrophobacterales bacterium]